MQRFLAKLVLAAFLPLLGGMAAAQESASQASVPSPGTHGQEAPSAMEAKPAAAPGTPKQDDVAPVKSKTATAQSPDDLICRRERETGSRMSKEVCRTRAQVEAQQRDAEEIKRQTLEKGNRVNKGG